MAQKYSKRSILLHPYHLILITVFSGCTPYVQPSRSPISAAHGITHRVAPGETLWRIAQHYGVDLEELVRANGISDVSHVRMGQTLIIPDRHPEEIPHREESAPRPEAALPAPTHTSPREEFVWPVRGKIISVFGMRQGAALNKGIDIQADHGADVMAARSGVVSFIHENLPGFGKTIILEHSDGFATVYAYIDQILIRQGEQVDQRQVIAKVGSTGRAEVPALHFEIRRHQKPQNPFHYLP